MMQVNPVLLLIGGSFTIHSLESFGFVRRATANAGQRQDWPSHMLRGPVLPLPGVCGSPPHESETPYYHRKILSRSHV